MLLWCLFPMAARAVRLAIKSYYGPLCFDPMRQRMFGVNQCSRNWNHHYYHYHHYYSYCYHWIVVTCESTWKHRALKKSATPWTSIVWYIYICMIMIWLCMYVFIVIYSHASAQKVNLYNFVLFLRITYKSIMLGLLCTTLTEMRGPLSQHSVAHGQVENNVKKRWTYDIWHIFPYAARIPVHALLCARQTVWIWDVGWWEAN